VWDVEACNRAGLPTLAVLSGGISRDELENAGARAVFDNTQELYERIDDTLIAKLPR
jgi:phosphoglycolate phosphatase-like HAD superfamily hydrolase